jgi:hypothetical protein
MTDGVINPLDTLVALKPEEMDFLSAVAKRAFQSVPRHPEPIYLKTKREMHRERPADKLYVASLAFQLPDPHLNSHEMPGPASRWPGDPYKAVTFKDDRPSWNDLPGIVEDVIQEGKDLDASPHFVLLNELSHSFEERDQLASKWTELARIHKTYIVAGTFHCTDEYFGVAPIYCPDPTKNTQAFKLNSALKQGERIRTPDTRELYIFETDFGNIVVWICLDMYDPGLVLKFLNVTHRFTGTMGKRATKKREISLVLVPAYSGDSEENISNCARTISQFSKTAMICTNSYLPDRLESYGFNGGEPLTPVFEKDYPLAGLEGTFCRAKLYGVDLKELEKHQAANYEQNGIFSSTFSAIINGGPYAVRDLPDSD